MPKTIFEKVLPFFNLQTVMEDFYRKPLHVVYIFNTELIQQTSMSAYFRLIISLKLGFCVEKSSILNDSDKNQYNNLDLSKLVTDDYFKV